MADAKPNRRRDAQCWLLRWIWFLCFLARSVIGADLGVTLAWNPSISTNVAGYKIYYGPASGAYTNAVFVGGFTNVTLSNLAAGNTYYFAATAVDVSQNESPFSNEAVYTVPTNTISAGPTYLITVQTSTNLITWSNSPIFFRLKITP